MFSYITGFLTDTFDKFKEKSHIRLIIYLMVSIFYVILRVIMKY